MRENELKSLHGLEQNLINGFLNLGECRIVAVCNVNRLHDRDSWQVSESDRA